MNKLHKFFLAAMILQATTIAASARMMMWQGDDTKRYVKNEAFGFGERLEYKVGYKFVTAGTAAFQIMPKPVIRNGQQYYDIRFDVKSLESLDFLYRVRDSYRTLVDVDGIFPLEFEQHIREGGYSRDFKAQFDQKANLARTTDGEFKIPDYVHDIVSAFYYVRTMDISNMKKGDVIRLQNFYGKETYDLGVKVLGKQTVETDIGKFRCTVIEPMVKEGGLFKSDGRIQIWMSDDDRKIPVKVSTKIPIGSIDAVITKYQGLRGPLVAKISDAND